MWRHPEREIRGISQRELVAEPRLEPTFRSQPSSLALQHHPLPAGRTVLAFRAREVQRVPLRWAPEELGLHQWG